MRKMSNWLVESSDVVCLGILPVVLNFLSVASQQSHIAYGLPKTNVIAGNLEFSSEIRP